MKLSKLKQIIAEEIKKVKENQYGGCENGIQLTPEQMSELVPAKLVMENPTKYGFSINEDLSAQPGYCISNSHQVCRDKCNSVEPSCAGTMCHCYLRHPGKTRMPMDMDRRF